MSYVFNSDLYPQVLDNIRHNYQVKIFNDLDPDVAISLFENTSAALPEFRTEWNQWILEYETQHFIDPDNFSHSLLEATAITALSMNECQDFWPQFYISLYIHDILVTYSQNASYPVDHILEGIVDFFEQRFHELRVEDTDLSFAIHKRLLYTNLLDFICIKKQFYNSTDLNASTTEINQTLGVNSCQAKFLIKMASNLAAKCSYSECADMYELVINAYIEYGKIDTYDILVLTLVAICIMCILLDAFEQWYFVYLKNSTYKFTTSFSTLIPGSYFRKVVNMMSLWLFILSVMTMTNRDTMRQTETWWVYPMTFSVVLCCILLTHTMRLFPTIGYLFNITFMMGNNVIYFSVVFAGVVYNFMFVTYVEKIFMHPQWPDKTFAGFRKPYDLMLALFRLFLHVDLNTLFSNSPVSVPGLLPLIVLLIMQSIVWLLQSLNMASREQPVMKEPRKELLLYMQWLEEALSAEYTFTVLCLPLRCCNWCTYISHHVAGYTVERGNDGKFKMYMPVKNLPISPMLSIDLRDYELALVLQMAMMLCILIHCCIFFSDIWPYLATLVQL